MKNNIITALSLFICVLVFNACFELDSVDPPGCTLQGRLIDKTTGEVVPQRQPGGATIRIKELNWKQEEAQEIEFTVKNDGTFQFTRLYPGTYRIHAYGGPFVPQVEMNGTNVVWDYSDTIEIKSTTNWDIEIEPYLRITWAEENPIVVNADSTITANFIVSRATSPERTDKYSKYAVKTARLLMSETPFVSMASEAYHSTYAASIELTDDPRFGSNLDEVLSVTSAGKISTKPMTYYVRIAAYVDDANFLQYNYSTVKAITAPLPVN